MMMTNPLTNGRRKVFLPAVRIVLTAIGWSVTQSEMMRMMKQTIMMKTKL